MSPTQTPERHTYLTIEDVAKQFGVTPRSVRRYIAQGELPAYRVGRHLVRIDAADVDNCLLRRISSAVEAATPKAAER